MRPWLVLLGVLVLLFAWCGSLGAVLPPFSAHMTLHMAVVAVAAPLIALGVAGRRWDPVRCWPSLFPALIASMVELVLVWGWHTPLLHRAARESALAFVLEQGSFLLSGLWLWLAAFAGGPARHERRGLGVLALLLTSMHMTLLGALLALPPRALYMLGAAHAHHHGEATAPVSSLSALDDQHLGGAIMIVLGGASYLLGALWLCFALLRRSGAQAERGAGT
jgi:putative membrane protein